MAQTNMPRLGTEFLPTTPAELREKGVEQPDFVLVSGDAYVDHPSFGAAVIGRVLAAAGYSVAMLPQPAYDTCRDFKRFGRPRYAFLISGGVVDSMVAHYTVAKRRRETDEYSPGGKPGKRPDRCVDVYTRLAKEAYPDVPVAVGGVEASLRRFAHYDYWSDAVRPSILETSGADLILFGMGERTVRDVAVGFANATDAEAALAAARQVPGVAYLCDFYKLPKKYAECASYRKVAEHAEAAAKACRVQIDNQDPVSALPVVQKQSEKYLVQNVPAEVLSREEMDAVYALPFTRRVHPMYDAAGGVPAIEEVEFSITHNRGCFGGCAYCAITLLAGRRVTSRSAESVLAEAEMLAGMPGFKGYIHDVGGPTANFRQPSCDKQLKSGVCKGGKRCLAPGPCADLVADHSEYLDILRNMRVIPGIKKVFIRSGIRYDYLMQDKNEDFFRALVAHHVSGQLKVAPEHSSPKVLRLMGKPSIDVYNRFEKRFLELSKQAGKEQYIVPYLISSHPGSTMKDAVELARYLKKHRLRPEQVQDFYPTPGSLATCMYHTGLDPYTLEKVYVPKKPEEKALQRALLQYYLPKNRAKVKQALQLCGMMNVEKELLKQ